MIKSSTKAGDQMKTACQTKAKKKPAAKKKSSTKDRREARAWLVLQGIRMKDIQSALEHQHPGQVYDTLRGVIDNRRVLQYLLDKGCPAAYLKLPKSMESK